MQVSASRKSGGLPKRFPVGTTYVVEGRAGDNGQLLVSSRFLVLPGGQRINVAADFGGPASPRARQSSRRHRKSLAQNPAKSRPARAKKFTAVGGTTQQYRR